MMAIQDVFSRPQVDSHGREVFLTRARALLLLALLLLTGLALLYLWQSWQMIYWLNQLHQARVELEALRAEHARLKFEVARAFSLKRIEQIATERLGMIRPTLRYLMLPQLEP
jgi:cell division protein FtsL